MHEGGHLSERSTRRKLKALSPAAQEELLGLLLAPEPRKRAALAALLSGGGEGKMGFSRAQGAALLPPLLKCLGAVIPSQLDPAPAPQPTPAPAPAPLTAPALAPAPAAATPVASAAAPLKGGGSVVEWADARADVARALGRAIAPAMGAAGPSRVSQLLALCEGLQLEPGEAQEVLAAMAKQKPP